MKKITLWLFALFTCWQLSAQTTVTIGTGTTNATGGTNGNPIYRSSAGSTFNFSQSIQLLTAADLAAAGVTAGSTISKIAFYKNDAFTMAAGRTATMNIYLKNSSATALTTASNFATWTTGSTNCYSNNTVAAANFPTAAGWVEFTFSTPFNYSGGAIETALDWAINTGTGSATTGAFSWLYTASPAIQAVGTSAGAAIGTANLATSQLRQYNTQITFSTTPCSGIPTPGNTVAPSPICSGSSATLSLQNATVGSGVTYQWYMNGLAISGANSGVYVIPSVTSINNYYCEVTCGGNTGVSSTVAVGPTLLTAPTTVETFTTYLPTCWLFGDNGDLATGPATFGTNTWKNDGFANSATTGSIAYNHYTTGANDWIISPVINIPSVGYELKFDASLTEWNGITAPATAWDAGDVLEVLVSTTGLDNWSVIYTIDNANPPANAGSTIAVDLDAFASQNIRIAYRVFSGPTDGADDTDIFVDNFTVLLSPTCPDQTGLIVGGITATGANTSWDDLSAGGALGYEYAITTSATPPATGTAIGATFNIASGLTPQTVYYLHVRASCATGTFGNWATTSFTTACVPVTSLPWNEGFEGLATGDNIFPACWGFVNTTSVWNIETFPVANTGANSLGRNWGTDGWAFTPSFTLNAGTSYRLSYYMRTQDTTVGYDVTTTVGSGQTVVDMTTTLGTPLVGYQGPSWNKFNFEFTPTTTGDYSFGVHVVAGFAPNGINFDDFRVELSPTCPDQTGLVVGGITATGANTSWDDLSAGGALGYDYAITTSATPPASGTATASTFYVASGLTPQTLYYLHVRASCAAGTFGNWSTVPFTTACVPVVALPWNEGFEGLATGNNIFPPCWGFVNTASVWNIETFPVANTGANSLGRTWSTDGWAFTPSFTLNAGTSYRLSYYMRTQDTTVGYDVTTTVGSGQTVVDMTTTLGTPLVGYQGPSWNKFNFEFTPTTTGDYSFGVHVVGPNPPNGINFDDFRVELTPTCPDQTGLVVGGITATGANTSWDDLSAGGALGYEYAITTSATSATSATPPATGTATASTFYVASGLSPQTVYYLHVRATCTPGSFGNWSTVPFTTACAPIASLPWIENFDAITVPALPQCWLEENGSWETSNETGFNTARSGANYLRDNWSATNEFMWTPGFDLVAGISYDFSSWIQGDGDTSWTVDFYANNAQNSAGATQLGGQYAVPGTVTFAIQPYAQVTRSFVPATSGTYYFGYRVNEATGNPWYVAVDDVEVKLSPSCPAPNASASGVTDVAANLNWAAVPSAAIGYEYVLDNVATDPVAGTATTAITYAATGLTPSTTYYFHIRTVCSAGNYSTWSTISFTTVATPPVNDNCATALVLTPGAIFATSPQIATNVGATNSAPTPAPTCGIFAGGDVWYTVTVPASGNITIETQANGTSLVNDTQFTVYSGSCGTFTQVGCDDEGGVGSFSLLALTGRPAGEILYVHAYIYNNSQIGTYQISAYDASLSASSFDKSTFVAYPNPVKDVLNLSYKSVISNVKVVNLLGQEVLNTKTNTNDVQVNMSVLNAGAYIVNITVEDTVHTLKVIKE